MSRGIDSNIRAILGSRNFQFCDLVEIQWDAADGGTERLTNAPSDVTYGGYTYTASAFLLGTDAVSESTQLTTGDLSLKLSGANQLYISKILGGAGVIDRKVKIYRYYFRKLFDSSNTLSSPIAQPTTLNLSENYAGPNTLEIAGNALEFRPNLVLAGGYSNGFLGLGYQIGDESYAAGAIQLFTGRINGWNMSETPNSSAVNLTLGNHWRDFERLQNRRTNSGSQHRWFPGDDGFEFSGSLASAQIEWGGSTATTTGRDPGTPTRF